MKISITQSISFLILTLITLAETSCKRNKNASEENIKTYVCIGTSASALSAAKTIKECAPSSQVICFSDETEYPYNKCKIHAYLSKGQPTKQPTTMTRNQADKDGIDLQLGKRVIDINPYEKYITLADNSSQPYDKLFIGTGTSPIFPSIPGLEKNCNNIFIYHNLHSINAMISYLDEKKPNNIIVIGAGLRGLECTDALKARGFDITIVSRGEQVLGERADTDGSMLIKKYIRMSNVNLETNATVQSVQHNNNHIQSVTLSSGKSLSCDMLVIAYGTSINNQLAQKAGLSMHQGGIKVDTSMMTSNQDIYAGGDVVFVKDNATEKYVRSSKWREAEAQGKIAGYNMTGNKKEYEGAFMINTSSFFGVRVLTCGPVKNIPKNYTIIKKQGPQMSHTFLVKDNILKGFCLVWDKASQAKPDTLFLKSLILSKKEINPRLLTEGELSNGKD